MSDENSGTVVLSGSVLERVERRIENSERFDSPDEYVEFVVSTVLSELEGSGGEPSEKDSREVQEHLEALGYAEE